MRAIVFGVGGGIGRALAAELVVRGTEKVIGVSRKPPENLGDVEWVRADITDEESLASLAAQLKTRQPIDLVIIATGILSDGDSLQPEKSYRQQDTANFERVFRINTFGPAMVAKHFLPLMPAKGRAVFAALSARVGSISDNRIGGWHAYRASKAALNMLIANYAIEQGRRNAAFIAVGLHPGTVDTALSQPFQANVPEGKLFTPEYSAACLLDVIEGLGPDNSGRVLDYAGKLVPA